MIKGKFVKLLDPVGAASSPVLPVTVTLVTSGEHLDSRLSVAIVQLVFEEHVQFAEYAPVQPKQATKLVILVVWQGPVVMGWSTYMVAFGKSPKKEPCWIVVTLGISNLDKLIFFLFPKRGCLN